MHFWCVKFLAPKSGRANFWTNLKSVHSNRTSYGVDQSLLQRHVWGKLEGGVMQHDSYFCNQWPENSPGFPSKRPNSTNNFVGAYRNGKPIWIECPKRCRRQHEWLFC